MQSGTASVAIAELYTSEGCDSCPPADKWFSSLSYRKGNAIPLAFHVDYWDAGGWKDRFAKSAFSLRQRETVVRLGSRTVVTPQLVVNGKTINVSASDDRRGSIYSRFNSRVSEIAARPPKAGLKLSATPSASTDGIDVSLTVTLVNPADSAVTTAWLAITENNLVSRVSAGENSGITLYHDHVVRELIGPLEITASADGNAPIGRSIALAKDWKRRDLSLVAFVQDQRTGEVYQALASPICKGESQPPVRQRRHGNSTTNGKEVSMPLKEKVNGTAGDGMHDLDFNVGRWSIHNRRLKKLFANADEWTTFETIQIGESLLGGLAQYDEIRTDSNEPIGMSIHVFNRNTRQWVSTWVGARDGAMQAPMVGAFVSGTGIFHGVDEHEGQPVQVRYIWSRTTTPNPRWEQAYSRDGGKNWETNWVMEYRRDTRDSGA